MIVMRLRQIVDEINHQRPEGTQRYSYYMLSKDAKVSISTVFRLIKETPTPQPVGRIDAAVCEKLLDTVNAKAREWHLPEYGIADLLWIIKPKKKAREVV